VAWVNTKIVDRMPPVTGHPTCRAPTNGLSSFCFEQALTEARNDLRSYVDAITQQGNAAQVRAANLAGHLSDLAR
jgi:hypothetical protein